MTGKAIQTLPEKARSLVMLSTGAIEQHGPQLPVGVDALLGQIFLDNALPLLPADAPVYVAPPIQIAKSNEHTGFPGTLILHRDRLRQLILAAGRQIHSWGFKRIGILNTHGGNISVVKSSLRELHLKYGLEVHVLNFPYEVEQSDREAAFGIHAGDLETSLMLAATPDLVDATAATCCWISSLESTGRLQAELAPATYAWKTLDISRSGTIGDASVATAEKGRASIASAAKALAAGLCSLVDLT
jgi:creatinine amidohydrolase